MIFVRNLRVPLLALCLVTLTPSARADDHAASLLFEALLDASIEAATDREQAGIESLQILLRFPDPWHSLVLERLENPDTLEALANARQRLPEHESRSLDHLFSNLAEAQDIPDETHYIEVGADEGHATLNWARGGTHWLRIDAEPESRNLLIQTDGCAPNLVAYSADQTLPLSRLRRQSRFAENLFALTVNSPVLIRAHAEDCHDPETRLALRWLAADTGSAAATGHAPSSPPHVIEPDRLTILTLAERPAQRVTFSARSGWLYHVQAAAYSSDVDPKLLRADPDDTARTAESDDDSGWGLAAVLDPIIGADRSEHLAVIRASPDQGDVAILLSQQPIPPVEIEVPERLTLSTEKTAWRRVELPAGTWTINAHDIEGVLDPVLSAYDEDTGRILDQNDDVDETTLASRVTLDLVAPTAVTIHIGAVVGAGSCELLVTADGRGIPTRASFIAAVDHRQRSSQTPPPSGNTTAITSKPLAGLSIHQVQHPSR